MEQLFITKVIIEKVRHLQNIEIPLSKDQLKHLIITGKNGSGKTSVLEAITTFLHSISTTDDYNNAIKGISLEFNVPLESIRIMFKEGQFILASYEANRVFEAEVPKHVEKVQLQDAYNIKESPRKCFVKYLLDLKMTEALAISGGKEEKAKKIKEWFEKFQQLLQEIFKDKTLQLQFDEDTFQFFICQEGKEPFDFNGLSSGYAAVLDIVVDIIIRMEKRTKKTFCFDFKNKSFCNARLQYITFIACLFSHANMKYSTFHDVNLDMCEMQNCNLDKSEMNFISCV